MTSKKVQFSMWARLSFAGVAFGMVCIIIRLIAKPKHSGLGNLVNPRYTPVDTITTHQARHSVTGLVEKLIHEEDFESLFYKVDIVREMENSARGVRSFTFCVCGQHQTF